MTTVPVLRAGIAELETRLGVERSTISRWVREGSFPRPHHLGRKRAWFIAEIQGWEARQMARTAEERRGGSR